MFVSIFGRVCFPRKCNSRRRRNKNNVCDYFSIQILSSTSYHYQKLLFRLRFFHKLLNNSDENAGNIEKLLSKLKPIIKYWYCWSFCPGLLTTTHTHTELQFYILYTEHSTETWKSVRSILHKISTLNWFYINSIPPGIKTWKLFQIYCGKLTFH